MREDSESPSVRKDSIYLSVMINVTAWRQTATQARAPLMEEQAQQQPHGGRIGLLWSLMEV